VDPFVAEIRIFAGNFAPKGWAMCNGQLMPISQNTALFSLLGTTYGGDGKSNFALPNLQGRVPIHYDQGPGLSLYSIGQSGGVETITLQQSEMPSHNHALHAADAPGPLSGPAGNVLARSAAGSALYAGTPNTAMSPAALDPAGGGLPHNNMQPYLTLNYIIALQGIYPSRSGPQAAPARGVNGGSAHE
jgi:microcystin-dependent protein